MRFAYPSSRIEGYSSRCAGVRLDELFDIDDPIWDEQITANHPEWIRLCLIGVVADVLVVGVAQGRPCPDDFETAVTLSIESRPLQVLHGGD